MQKEKYIRLVFDKDVLPIKHYPESRFFACVIPKQVRVSSGIGSIPKRVTGNSREAVVDKLFDILIGIDTTSNDKTTLSTLFNDFIETRKADPDFAAHTVRKNICDWNTFFKDAPFVKVKISMIQPADLMDHFKHMTEGRKMTRHAFGNAKGLLNQLFDLAFERNLIDRNICRELSTRKLKFKPEACKQDLVYSTEERNMICDALEDSDCVYDRAIIMQFCLGCRISEIRGLYWSDIDFDRKEVTIHRELVDDEDGSPILNNYTKNGMSEGNRVLPLTPRAERMLMKIPKPENKDSLIFVRDYKPIRTQTVNDHLRNICRKLGIRYLSTHKIRAWGITEALASGMDQASVMRIAGHASPETMRHYVRVARVKKDIGEHFSSVFD
ncbi:MAG: site-specific integrase [Lachnospiraceae bacterium]|nr:site-specific integrase [Lachnospiraceae bacterium]